MSDDTPTERFDPIDKPESSSEPAPTLRLPAASGDTPAAPTTPMPAPAPAAPADATTPIPGPAPAAAPAAPTTPYSAPTPAPQSWTAGPSRPRRTPGSRGPIIAFVILAILVVAAIVVLVVVLIGRASPIAAPTSTGSASASASTAPAPPAPSNTTPPAPAPAPAGSFTSFVAQPQQAGCFGGRGRDGKNTEVQVSWATQNAVSVWVATGTSDAADAGTMQIPASGDQSDFPQPLLYDCSQQTNTFTMTLVDANGAHVSKTWTVTLRDRHR